jgi:DNA-binding protein H-NS
MGSGLHRGAPSIPNCNFVSPVLLRVLTGKSRNPRTLGTGKGEALMAKTDLNKMCLDELRQLAKDIDKEMKRRAAQAKTKALASIEATAKEHGFDLKDLLGVSGKAPSAPKYAHPENPELTWTGRGRQPRWIKEGLNAGKSLDDFSIAR